MRFILDFLSCPITTEEGEQRANIRTGLAQGSPLSPVLMNIYLLELDIFIQEMCDKDYPCHFLFARYVDDLLIGISDRTKSAELLGIRKEKLSHLGLSTRDNLGRKVTFLGHILIIDGRSIQVLTPRKQEVFGRERLGFIHELTIGDESWSNCEILLSRFFALS